MAKQSVSKIVRPSAEVREEALARARRLAQGLFPHQVEGVAFLLARRRAILADDMGLGKTRQSIVALAEAAPAGPWLVVCPASVKRNWAREIEITRPGAEIHVVGPAPAPATGFSGWVIVNYDLLTKHQDALADFPWGGVIFDEAHFLKNHTSKRSKLARAIVDDAKDAVIHCLTGTPLTNRPRDLFPLLQLVAHPMGRSFLSFAKRYCAASHNGYGWVTDGASNLDELRVQLHGVMLRRTKDEVLDLPPKVRTWAAVEVPEGTARQQTRRVLELLLLAQASNSVADGTGRKLRTGQDRIQLLGALTKVRLTVAKAKVASTIEFVQGAVDQGEKVIVFTGFDEPAHKIAEHFGDAAVLLTGSTPTAARQKLVDRFGTDDRVRVFVANIVAGGVGINLTAASQVVFNDLDWVPANHWQAEDRAYRIGQSRTVNVTYFVAKDTVDEFVCNALDAKAALVDAVVEGTGGPVPDGDLLSDLERMISALSPGIATLDDATSGEDPIDRLLRQLADAARVEARSPAEAKARAALAQLPEAAILALAHAIAGPVGQRYRAASTSKPGQFYVLQVDGGDVACTCRGFEYRGACAHARGLKAALATGGGLPDGVTAEA